MSVYKFNYLMQKVRSYIVAILTTSTAEEYAFEIGDEFTVSLAKGKSKVQQERIRSSTFRGKDDQALSFLEEDSIDDSDQEHESNDVEEISPILAIPSSRERENSIENGLTMEKSKGHLKSSSSEAKAEGCFDSNNNIDEAFETQCTFEYEDFIFQDDTRKDIPKREEDSASESESMESEVESESVDDIELVRDISHDSFAARGAPPNELELSFLSDIPIVCSGTPNELETSELDSNALSEINDEAMTHIDDTRKLTTDSVQNFSYDIGSEDKEVELSFLSDTDIIVATVDPIETQDLRCDLGFEPTSETSPLHHHVSSRSSGLVGRESDGDGNIESESGARGDESECGIAVVRQSPVGTLLPVSVASGALKNIVLSGVLHSEKSHRNAQERQSRDK